MTVVLLFVVYAIALSMALAGAGHWGSAAASPVKTTPRPQRILIVGATGGTGRQLVAQALERGHTVTALARNPSRLQMTHPRLTVVRGDVLDGASVDAAMHGQDAVLSALGHNRYLGPTRILSRGTGHILRAMEARGVSRFVCETSLGLGESAFRLGLFYTLFIIPVILPFYFWDKTRQERMIAASRVPWVIVRPGVLTNGAKRGVVRHGSGIGNFLWTARISRADVAAFMLNQLESDTYLGSSPGVSW
jgi:uncharacterized protein YbjT (DUF2867 family)